MLVNKNIDILEFNLLVSSNELSYNNIFNIYKCSHFKSNINLTSMKYNKNYKDLEQDKELLFNKFIKTKLFKNIIKYYIFKKFKGIMNNNYFII